MQPGDGGYAQLFDFLDVTPSPLAAARVNQRMAARQASRAGVNEPIAPQDVVGAMPSNFQITEGDLDDAYLESYTGLQTAYRSLLEKGIDPLNPDTRNPYALEASRAFRDMQKRHMMTREMLTQGKALQDKMLAEQYAGRIVAPSDMGQLMTYERAQQDPVQLQMEMVDREINALLAADPKTEEDYDLWVAQKKAFADNLTRLAQEGIINPETARTQIARLAGPNRPDLEMRQAELNRTRAQTAAASRANRQGPSSTDFFLDPRTRNIAYQMGERDRKFNELLASLGGNRAVAGKALTAWYENNPEKKRELETQMMSLPVRGREGAVKSFEIDGKGNYVLTINGQIVTREDVPAALGDQSGTNNLSSGKKSATTKEEDWKITIAPGDAAPVAYWSATTFNEAKDILDDFDAAGFISAEGKLSPEKFYSTLNRFAPQTTQAQEAQEVDQDMISVFNLLGKTNQTNYVTRPK